MYYKNRYYIINLARFTVRDPIGIQDGLSIFEFDDFGLPSLLHDFNPKNQYEDGMNVYEYVKSNPLNEIDPGGLSIAPIPPKDFFRPPPCVWREIEREYYGFYGWLPGLEVGYLLNPRFCTYFGTEYWVVVHGCFKEGSIMPEKKRSKAKIFISKRVIDKDYIDAFFGICGCPFRIYLAPQEDTKYNRPWEYL